MGHSDTLEAPKAPGPPVQPFVRAFTPGPWLVNELYEGGPLVVYVRLPDQYREAWSRSTNETYTPVPPVCRLECCGALAAQRWANARLIASAPDLLAGCEAAADALERLGVTALSETLRATITKALRQ